MRSLREGNRLGQTYKQVFESLNTVNGHSAAMWKDYYLDHTCRFDRLVKEGLGVDTQPVRTGTLVPVVPHILNEARASESANPRLVSHAEDLRTPSRFPSPPTKIVKTSQGMYRFTDTEIVFMAKYTKWMLSQDATVSGSAICRELERKAPHHRIRSWGAKWRLDPQCRKYFAQASEIYARAQGRADYRQSNEDIEDSEPPLRTAQSDEPIISEIRSVNSLQRRVRFAGNYYAEVPSMALRSSSRRGKGSPFTKEERQNMARYIASRSNTQHVTKTVLSNDFASLFPSRSGRLWAQNYRNHKKEIDRAIIAYRTADASIKQEEAEQVDSVSRKRSFEDVTGATRQSPKKKAKTKSRK